MGRKSTVTLNINFKDFKLKVKENKIIDCFFSSVKPFNSGAYIPISQKYNNKKVIILILDELNGDEKNELANSKHNSSFY